MTETKTLRKAVKDVNPFAYVQLHNDKRKGGKRRRALKSMDLTRQDAKRVLYRMNARGISGWKLWSGKTWYGRAQHGLTKHT